MWAENFEGIIHLAKWPVFLQMLGWLIFLQRLLSNDLWSTGKNRSEIQSLSTQEKHQRERVLTQARVPSKKKHRYRTSSFCCLVYRAGVRIHSVRYILCDTFCAIHSITLYHTVTLGPLYPVLHRLSLSLPLFVCTTGRLLFFSPPETASTAAYRKS